MPDTPEPPGQQPSHDELKKAIKAFKKRLKLTRLDAESKISRRPVTGGQPSGIVAITPPNQFPQAVWDESTGKLVWQRMQDMVVADLMPLQGVTGVEVEPLTCEEKSTLLGWLDRHSL